MFEAARMKISGCQGTGFGQILQLPNPSTPNINQKNSKTKRIKISQLCLNCPELVRIFQNLHLLANRSQKIQNSHVKYHGSKLLKHSSFSFQFNIFLYCQVVRYLLLCFHKGSTFNSAKMVTALVD